ncbi:MAG: RNA polymerase sigma factor [Myxococcota bacterium]
MTYPFGDADDDADEALVRAANAGEHAALDRLVRRHQRWVFNLALRMLHDPEDAADASQEIMVKAIVGLSKFEGRSRFRTWLYQIAANHLLRRRRTPRSFQGITFERFGAGLRDVPDAPVPRSRVPAELLVRESMVGCTTAMLLCLGPEQRLAFLIGDVFGATDRVAAEILQISPAAFRKRLSRARADLRAFLRGNCGLMDPANSCRCRKKTHGFIRAGYVDAERLQFARQHLDRVRDVVPATIDALDEAHRDAARIFRDHAFYEGPDLAGKLGELLATVPTA